MPKIRIQPKKVKIRHDLSMPGSSTMKNEYRTDSFFGDRYKDGSKSKKKPLNYQLMEAKIVK